MRLSGAFKNQLILQHCITNISLLRLRKVFIVIFLEEISMYSILDDTM